ncbi:MAG: hypothetical protein PHG89_11000 [Gallionella sp.]|nr:hypothetical protein [Gallionella sp.]
MATITQYFEQAQLSLAAYALNLHTGMVSTINNPMPDYVKALTDGGMSQTQAGTFASTYTVVDQYTNPLSGCSVTVFDNGGVKYLAVRGTEPNTLGVVMDVITDIGVFQGLNGQQQYQQLQSYYQSLIASGKIPSVGVMVTGHSLGGLLAQMLAVDQAGQIAQTTTFNAPGVGGIGAQILQSVGLLPGSIPLTGVTNVYAQPGLSATAGLGTLLGDTQSVFIEANLDPLHNHAMSTLTDSLAVYNLFAQLEPTAGLNTLTAILKAESNIAANSLESAVSALGKLFNVSGTVFSGNEFDSSANGRDLLYKAVQDITAALPANTAYTLRDLSAFNAAQLVSVAQNNLAYRYALVNGNPFAVTGDATLYDAHNANGELELFNTTDHTGSLTDRYLSDRAAWLSRQLAANAADTSTLNDKGPSDWQYTDQTTHGTLTVKGGLLAGLTPARQIVFGSDAADSGNGALSGGDQADSLYGMNGADTLIGGKGNDYLEGGQGNDTYIWNSGDGLDTIRDTDGLGSIVINGQTLAIGESRDGGRTFILKDSANNDHTCTVLSGDINAAGGATLLIDNAVEILNYRKGELGLTLNGAAATQPTPPGSTSHDIIGDPLIHSATIAPGGQAPDWQVVNAYNQQYVDDGNGGQTLIAYDVDYFLVDADRNPVEPGGPVRADNLRDTAGNDHIVSGGGNDTITLSRGGNDIVEAGDGNDTLSKTGAGSLTADLGAGDDTLYGSGSSGVITANGGAGRDSLSGGSAADLLIGGTGADILAGGLGNDRLYGDSEITAEQAILNGNADIGNGLKGDWLAGNAGDDTLISGAGNDVLSGGGGNDLLIAGAGNDYILGDADYTAQSFDWTATASNGNTLFQPATGPTNPADSGNDVIYAGDGNDQVWAGAGNDIVFGEGGNDTLIGEAGSDTLLGGAGNDTLYGDASYIDPALQGNDFLDGGDGNDHLTGDGGNDTLIGGAGNDQLGGGAGTNYLDGGDGNDTLYGDSNGNTLLGGAGDDELGISNASDNFLDGGTGNDTLTALGGGNYLYAGTGNDSLLGGLGDDKLYAGEGTNYLDGGDTLASARWRWRMHAAQHRRDAANDAAAMWRAAA